MRHARRALAIAAVAALLPLGTIAQMRGERLLQFARVGRLPSGAYLVASRQTVRPAGDAVRFFGRPSDLALNPSDTLLAVKNSHGIVFIDVTKWRITQTLALPKLGVDYPEHLGGNGPAGLLWNAQGTQVWTTDAFGWLHGARRGSDGRFGWSDRIPLAGPSGSLVLKQDQNTATIDASAPICVTYGRRASQLLVALSRNNTLASVDLRSRRIAYQVPVGVAPFGVVRIGDKAFVTNWGGRRSSGKAPTADSSGTRIRIDPKTGVANSGSVSVVDLTAKRVVAELDVGLHPSALLAAPDGRHVCVANSSSDTVSIVETTSARVVSTIALDGDGLVGRAPDALAIDRSGRTLFVAEGGMNDIALVDLRSNAVLSHVAAGWYPAGVAVAGGRLFIADLKGVGSRARDLGLPVVIDAHRRGGYNVYDWAGVVQSVALDAVPRDRPQPMRTTASDGSRLQRLFKHVLYIIKENHTYDEIFGDLSRGNGDKRLCTFCGVVTPNHHALAERFGLFDDFYVNSVLSGDGHNWTDEGYATDYLERSMSGWARSYPSDGTDALAYSPAGFIWNRVLAAGLTFRDYGEFLPDVDSFDPASATWRELYDDYRVGRNRIRWKQKVGIEPLRRYVNFRYPSFSLRIPDQYRASIFIDDLRHFERVQRMPNLMVMALGNDHTSGTIPGRPTPRASVADNDLALGRIVEAISRSRFWRDTVIFVIEDDAQDGLDHVDGQRTVALVISAYNKPHLIDSRFYNQTSILRTIELIMGVPPMTRFDRDATPIAVPFGSMPDLQPFRALKNEVPLDELNPPDARLSGLELQDARTSARLDLDHADRASAELAAIIRRWAGRRQVH